MLDGYLRSQWFGAHLGRHAGGGEHVGEDLGEMAGVAALGVSWGYHSVAELEATGAVAIADHGSMLAAHVDALLAANTTRGRRR